MSDTTYITNVFVCPNCEEVFESPADGVICEDCNEDCGESIGWFETVKGGGTQGEKED